MFLIFKTICRALKLLAELSVGQIHYAECGERQAKAVLLLHQTPRSWDEYRDVLPVLGRHFRAIAMDTIGFGDSTKPALGQDSIEHWAQTAIDLADALGIARLSVVGHHTGAAIAILGRGGHSGVAVEFHSGYVIALASAFVWASYSLLTRRLPAFPTAAVGGFAAASGVLSLVCHALLEPAVALGTQDLVLIAILGLGPLGGAFFLWDAAIKLGDTRRIGLLAFATPILSTVMLLLTTGQALQWNVAVAAALVVGAAWLGSR